MRALPPWEFVLNEIARGLFCDHDAMVKFMRFCPHSFHGGVDLRLRLINDFSSWITATITEENYVQFTNWIASYITMSSRYSVGEFLQAKNLAIFLYKAVRVGIPDPVNQSIAFAMNSHRNAEDFADEALTKAGYVVDHSDGYAKWTQRKSGDVIALNRPQGGALLRPKKHTTPPCVPHMPAATGESMGAQ